MASSITSKRKPLLKKRALDFINSIESNWKGNEEVAFWLVQKIKPKIVVDLGFSEGLSTLALSFNNSGHVYAIDWFFDSDYTRKSHVLDLAFRNISDAIFCKYVKNVHLIIGPLLEVGKTWEKEIDILHINGIYSYAEIKKCYEEWKHFLRPEAVILFHNLQSKKSGPRKFYEELSLPKTELFKGNGLAVASKNQVLISEIVKLFA